nr:hypothetical protein [Sinorhizobium americanum]
MGQAARFAGSRTDDALGTFRQGGNRRAAAQQLGFRASDRFRIDFCDPVKPIAAGDGADPSDLKNAGIHIVEETFFDHLEIVPHGFFP